MNKKIPAILLVLLVVLMLGATCFAQTTPQPATQGEAPAVTATLAPDASVMPISANAQSAAQPTATPSKEAAEAGLTQAEYLQQKNTFMGRWALTVIMAATIFMGIVLTKSAWAEEGMLDSLGRLKPQYCILSRNRNRKSSKKK